LIKVIFMHKRPTAHAQALKDALTAEGVPVTCECSDGHKHVDICIKAARLYIEVDGLSHVTQAKQIETDFKRDSWSETDGFDTLRIANAEIEQDLKHIVRAIKNVVNHRLQGDSV
jgi:very-short-patch-repair endonuclease